MKIRIRWLDALTYRSPRYVVDGTTLHRGASKRIHTFAEKDARDAWRRGGPEGRRMYLAVLLSLAFSLPAPVAFPLLQLWISGAFDEAFEGSPEWADGLVGFLHIVPILAGVVLLVLVLNRIWLWAMRPQLFRAVQTVGAEHCLLCDYDLRGHTSGARCPECGTERLAMSEALP